jgi:molybdopterin molybdotransferase
MPEVHLTFKHMITVSEASAIISSHLFKPAMGEISLIASTGRVLAERISADRDFPPFNRVSMDGIAIDFEEWSKGRRAFLIEGTQAAGEPQKILGDKSHCFEVMTGAMLPGGCDTVIRYEDLNINGKEATLTTGIISRGQSVHQQASDARKNGVLLEPGMIISPAEVALLAAVGKSKVQIFEFPKAAIISTGDELVAVESIPELHQIRRSNCNALQSAMMRMGWDASVFHLEDEKKMMASAMQKIIKTCDVIILSGGVSQGKFDFVPSILEDMGIQRLFHGVGQRPGKPFWFGKSAAGKVAFALPGNPVSTFLCFYKYVKPWACESMGISQMNSSAVLASDFSFSGPLTYFLQVSVKNENGTLMAFPVAGGGSGDFANLKNVSGFLELPAEIIHFKAGEVFPDLVFRH